MSGWGRRPPGFLPHVEAVEDRILLATFTVGPAGSGSMFTTITAAVNAANAAPNPSNTVLVSPGTYTEANIPISSPLSLISTNGAAATTINGNNLNEPTSGILTITNTQGGSVTVGRPGQGFTFINPVIAPDGTRSLVAVENTSAPVTVQNDVFTGLNGVVGANGSGPFDVGLLVTNAQIGGSVTIQNNTFQQLFQGVLDEQPLGGGAISGNTFQNLAASTFTSNGTTSTYEPDGIFALTYGGVADNVSGFSITGNNFTNFNGLAITVSGGYQGQTPSQFSNVQISSNIITSIGFAANDFRAGILLIDDADTAAGEPLGGVVSSTISNNVIQAQVPCASGSIGVWVLGADNNNTISNNTISNLDRGINIQEQVTGAGFASGLTVTQNAFLGNNIAIFNPSPNVVSAPLNYYGTVDPTLVQAQNNGGVNVDYNPYLADGTDTSPAPGFQPNLSPADTNTVRVTGLDTARSGQPYTVNIQVTPDPNVGPLSSIIINFGDNTEAVVPPGTTSVQHTYNVSSQTMFPISAAVVTTGGQVYAVPGFFFVTVTTVSTLIETSFTPTASGFAVRFNGPIDTSVLNLYSGIDNAGAANSGPPDVTLNRGTGANATSIQGSIKLDPDNRGFQFVKTGAPLVSGTYVATLISGTSAIQGANGVGPLDGARTGVAGSGNFTTTFTVTAPTTATISLPDFARGPKQPVNIPANGIGLPITISDGTGVSGVMFTLTYDPTLLTITSETLGASMPAGTEFVVNATIPGRLAICVETPPGTTLPSGAQTLISLTASVPATAPYRAKDLLQLQLTSINGTSTANGTTTTSPTTAIGGDEAIGLVTFLGDANGNGRYNGADANDISRVAVGLDTGFGVFPLVDPLIIGDTNTDGRINGADANRVSQFVVGLPVPTIPAYPGPPANFSTGPDPLVSIPKSLAGQVGDTVSVPVGLLQTNNAPIQLDSFALVISFDPAVFRVSNVGLGSLTSGFQLLERVDNTTGMIYVSGFTHRPITLDPGALGSLLQMNFTILSNPAGGASSINLRANSDSGVLMTSLDDGGLTLVPAPTNGPNDPVDGLVTIGAHAPRGIIPQSPVGSAWATATGRFLDFAGTGQANPVSGGIAIPLDLGSDRTATPAIILGTTRRVVSRQPIPDKIVVPVDKFV